MPPVELRHLEALVAVAEEGTFGGAAARMGYTQSTVSQRIAALERSVGGPVFDRPPGPRRVRLTPLGTVVLDEGRSLLAQASRLGDAVDRHHAGGGRIDIGTFQSVSHVILPTLVRRLREEHPDCDVRLSEGEPESPAIGDLDLLFHDGPVDGDVAHALLLDDPYLLLARAGDFADGPVPLDGLDDAPLVAWPLTCDQPAMEAALARAGAHPRVVFRSAVNDTLVSMVRAGLGSAVLPRLAIVASETERDPQLRVHALSPAPPARQVHLYWSADRSRSPLAVRATEIALEVARDAVGSR